MSKFGYSCLIFFNSEGKVNGAYYRNVFMSQQLLPTICQASLLFFRRQSPLLHLTLPNITLGSNFVIKKSLTIPPHPRHVATLLCDLPLVTMQVSDCHLFYNITNIDSFVTSWNTCFCGRVVNALGRHVQ